MVKAVMHKINPQATENASSISGHILCCSYHTAAQLHCLHPFKHSEYITTDCTVFVYSKTCIKNVFNTFKIIITSHPNPVKFIWCGSGSACSIMKCTRLLLLLTAYVYFKKRFDIYWDLDELVTTRNQIEDTVTLGFN